uniref:Uncharacterized protein n=1 Tax=Tetraselmis sp. GSL018 TaxID=582737 RepID=A0A061SKX3_9CHLO
MSTFMRITSQETDAVTRVLPMFLTCAACFSFGLISPKIYRALRKLSTCKKEQSFPWKALARALKIYDKRLSDLSLKTVTRLVENMYNANEKRPTEHLGR